MIYNVALDIDQVLAFGHAKDFDQARFFFNKGAVLTAIKTHYIYPGVIEFIRLVALAPDVNLTFYSAGHKVRNLSLVPQLLNLALPEPKFADLKSRVRVLSSEDLVYSMRRDPNYNLVELSHKDLRKVVSEDEKLENAVLIDDQTANVAFGQHFNFLKVPVSEADEYASLIERMNVYDPESGMRFLKCLISTLGSKEELVKTGNRLVIRQNAEGFQIEFVDQNFDVQVANVCPEFHEELYQQLDYFYQKISKSGAGRGYISDPVVVENICNYVSTCGGKSTKICRKANRICYVAGMLFAAMNSAVTENISLAKALELHQFTVNMAEKQCVLNFGTLKKDDRYYWAGLDLLRMVNPGYEFITPHSYHANSKRMISKKSRMFLERALKNEFQRAL